MKKTLLALSSVLLAQAAVAQAPPLVAPQSCAQSAACLLLKAQDLKDLRDWEEDQLALCKTLLNEARRLPGVRPDLPQGTEHPYP